MPARHHTPIAVASIATTRHHRRRQHAHTPNRTEEQASRRRVPVLAWSQLPTTLHAFASIPLLYCHSRQHPLCAGDSQFYTSGPQAGAEVTPFSYCIQHVLLHSTRLHICVVHSHAPQEIPEIFTTKTGLGSSAALVSSLVAALFHYVGLMDNQQQRDLSHNVAQFCHCSAQGKVGSGFDVSAAFYGRSADICCDPCPVTSLVFVVTLSPVRRSPYSQPLPQSALLPVRCQFAEPAARGTQRARAHLCVYAP
jgi:hypothetical protein